MYYYEQVSSTMDVAREKLQTNPQDSPLLVVANEQTAGRGRQQRRWDAPAGTALLFSLALHPIWLDPAHASALIWMTGVAVCEAITETTGLKPLLKWPNDVLLPVHPRPPEAPLSETPGASSPSAVAKVAGILLEAGSSQHRVEWAVVGCGINVNATPSGECSLRYPATCLAHLVGSPLDRSVVLRAVLKRLGHWYVALEWGEQELLFLRWRELLHTIGKEVVIQTFEGTIRGVAEGVERSGALRVRDASGVLRYIANGDVS